MARKPTGRPSQRPCAPIDWKKVEVMMFAGSSGTEIAAAMGIHHATFYERYEKEYGLAFSQDAPIKKRGGHGNVRTRQYISALHGNTQMLKLLGEEWLGQGKGSTDYSNETRSLIADQQNVNEMASTIQPGSAIESGVEAEPLISHQECTGEEDPIRDELGSGNTMEGETQL